MSSPDEAAKAHVQVHVVVHPVTDQEEDRPYRRVDVNGRSVGNAYAAADVTEFLRRAGLDAARIADPRIIEWRGGGPDTWV